jgi:hypothetical protein
MRASPLRSGGTREHSAGAATAAARAQVEKYNGAEAARAVASREAGAVGYLHVSRGPGAGGCVSLARW